MYYYEVFFSCTTECVSHYGYILYPPPWVKYIFSFQIVASSLSKSVGYRFQGDLLNINKSFKVIKIRSHEGLTVEIYERLQE